MSSNRLPVLAAEIRRAHADVQEAAKTAAEHAIRAGHALIEAKKLVKHGEWLPWLREHCALPERTAQLYMRIAKSGLESATDADLGLQAAAKAMVIHLADPWEEQEPEHLREWLVHMLFMVSVDYQPAFAERWSHWAQRNGFDTPSMWFGTEGDRYRRFYGFKAVTEDGKRQWREFLASQEGRTTEEIDAELRAIAEAAPDEPIQMPKRRRRRR
jgi:hypothetical protein